MIGAMQVSSQTIYQRLWTKSAIIIGGSAVMFGTNVWIENNRGTITIADINALNRC